MAIQQAIPSHGSQSISVGANNLFAPAYNLQLNAQGLLWSQQKRSH